MPPPKSLDDWSVTLRRRFRRQNRELGINSERTVEVFRVTAWGEVPELKTLLHDFPALLEGASPLKTVEERLAHWRLLP
jgi:hypothetical protein